MSDNNGKQIHSFRVGKTWFNIWENYNPETEKTYTTTIVNHSYRDKDSGEWKPTRSFSESELADLEMGAAEARRRLRINEVGREKDEPGEGHFQKKVARKRATKNSAPAKE